MANRKHRVRLILALSAQFLLTGCAALVSSRCVPQPSTWDSAIGVVELGASYGDLPRALNPTDDICLQEDPKECDYSRVGAVLYLDIGRGIFAKGMDVHSMYADPLPFGLSKFDRVKDVIRKIKPYWKNRVEVIKNEDGVVETIRSGYCFVNSRGKIFSMSIGFLLSGQIEDISTSTKDPYNLGSERP